RITDSPRLRDPAELRRTDTHRRDAARHIEGAGSIDRPGAPGSERGIGASRMNSNAVATVERMPAPTSESGHVLELISRIASDPSADIDKLKELMAMHREMETERAIKAFNAAMNAAQSEMGRISADATNPQTRSKYATYGKLDATLRPIYTRHGFALSFDEGEAPAPDYVRVLCYVSHSDGHCKTYAKNMPADGKGAKGNDVMTKTHAAGAAMQYGMRYLLKGIFNVAIGEDDTDGNGAKAETI